MIRSLLAGVAYFAIAFAAGVAMGLVRIVWLMPAIGELTALALELPIILAFSWWLSSWLVRLIRVPAAAGNRLAMGWTAFALLMLAELIVSVQLAGSGVGEHFMDYLSAPGLLALLGQVAFAFIPVLQLSRPAAYFESQLS